MTNSLSKRDQEILQILISDYISTASPVGSRVISQKHGGRLSPATIRSVMADLEKMGFLKQPHTSAGRIPTSQGLRYYVDCLLKCHDLSSEERDQVKGFFNTDDLSVDDIMNRTSKLLSTISNYVGLIRTPGWDRIVFKQIEFIGLSRGRLLGIFVSQEGFVQNRIIEVSEEYSYPDLEKINRYCNAAFLGLTLEEAREKITRELEVAEGDYDKLLLRALLFSQEVFSGVPNADVIVEGESRLLGEPEFSNAARLKELLEILEEKKYLLNLLDRCREVDGVKIFVGAEAELQDEENQAIESVSLVTAPYRKDGNILGTIGVIGPTRMDYSRVVSIVDFTAKVLEDILN
jgi:heat-inducible transcriptional repressor